MTPVATPENSVNTRLSEAADSEGQRQTNPRPGSQMTKDEAQQEAVRRWYMLPAHDRETYDQAEAYAIRLDLELVFDCYTDPRSLIAAWLIREVTKQRALERDARIAAERLVFVDDLANAEAEAQADALAAIADLRAEPEAEAA
jgi:hypothetical protein